MTGVVLFGGTTEGRQLAQALDGLCAAQREYIGSDEYGRYARCILASPADGFCHLVVCFFKAEE